jgi:hypothetical protein
MMRIMLVTLEVLIGWMSASPLRVHIGALPGMRVERREVLLARQYLIMMEE